MKRGFLFFAALIIAISQMITYARQSLPLADGWSFAKGCDVTGCQPVAMPHTWNTDDGCTPDYYRGDGVYKCVFNAPKTADGERVFLRFEGVSLTADVYCNGKHLGSHNGAFTAFCFEITDALLPQSNTLIVKVSNKKNADVIPLAGDFSVFGGIYRPVSLLVLPRVCISPLDCASPGVYISQKKVSAEEAVLDVSAVVDFGKARAEKCDIATCVYDASGVKMEVSATRSAMVKTADGRYMLKQTISLRHPHLWQGIDDPYLYDFKVVLTVNGKIVDTVNQNIGLRSFSVDCRKGFFLNGKPHNIRGVNRHQDRKGKGWAISTADQLEDFAFIREIGANGVRLAHYPQAAMVYDLCDKYGVLVWSEIPFIERGNDGSDAFSNNTKKQLREMIRQNYNHASVFCWGLFNELGEGHPENLVWQLNEMAHLEDPTRYTVAASNHDNRPDNYYTDIMAYNTYPGWYWADPATMRYAVDWKYKPENKQPGLGVSEYGAGASIHQHEDNAKKPVTDGVWHPEEWQAICHEGNYAEIAKRDWIWGSFVWNLFDFASATRKEGDAMGINDKGLVTYDRSTRKDAFYYYKAQWNKEPMVHICSKRFVERTQAETVVKVYSNCSDVQVWVNGKLLETVNPCNNVYVWRDVKLNKGSNKVTAKARMGETAVEDNCVWNLK